MASDHEVAKVLSRLPPQRHPLHPVHGSANRAKLAAADPQLHAQVMRIAASPTLAAVATSGGDSTSAGDPTAADPTGSNVAGTDEHLGWGNIIGRRHPEVRHVLLGFTTIALAAAASAPAKATSTVDFKANRLVSIPTVLFNGTIANIQSGVRPQYVNGAAEDLDMYQPGSYGGELDLDPVPAAIPMQAQITNNGNATASWNGCFVGTSVGMPYRKLTSKLMDGSLGTSGSVSAGGTGSLTLTPYIGYTTRKVLLTPGTGFADVFLITSIAAGVQPQLMSGDPIPAAIFNDLYPLFVDFDRVTAAVPLTIAYTNVGASAAVLKGTTRGDVDMRDLASFGTMRRAGG